MFWTEISLMILCLLILIWHFVPRIQRFEGQGMAKIHYFDFPFASGDFLMFPGKSNIFKAVSATIYTHAGIVYRDPKTSQLYIYHLSGGNNFFNAMINAHKTKNKSVILQPLYRFLEKSKRYPVVRKLSPPYQKPMPLHTIKHLCFDSDAYLRKWGSFWPNFLPFIQTHFKKNEQTSCDEALTRLQKHFVFSYALTNPVRKTYICW